MPAADGPNETGTGDLQLIRQAAREAGGIAMRYFKRNPEVWLKGGHSPVSEADYAVDRFLRETLISARPDYGWLSEETADTTARLAARRTFVVDPIDGTRSFLEGRSTWCVSVAVVEDGRPVAGVVDCPAKDEIYWAETGGGAWRNGDRLVVSSDLANPLIGGPKVLLDAAVARLPVPFRRSDYIPSLAYRISMVASSKLDATFVKPNSHDWDIAAAAVVLAETGGRIVDAAGKTVTYGGENPRNGVLAAGRGPLLEAMIPVIAAAEF